MSKMFDTVSSVVTDCGLMRDAQQSNMRNRSLVNKLFNGESMVTDEERREQNLKTVVNFLEGSRIASNAVHSLNNGFEKGDRYFSVSLDKGPIHKRAVWSSYITSCINKELKRSSLFRNNHESARAQVVLHGPGPLVWPNKRTPVAKCFGVEDMLLPSGTLTSMENLDRFGVYQELTWGELNRMTKGKNVDKGWNMPYVKALMVTMFNQSIRPVYQGNRWLFPEKIWEDIKEGSAFSVSSSLPKVGIWNFFYQDEDSGKWIKKIALDYGTINKEKVKEGDDVRRYQQFLYEDEKYADDWHEIAHWYIGNCSNVAPYRYYSIRSIGYLLYGVCLISNKIRCRFTDHIFQQLLTLFRNVSDDQREKLGMIDLQNFGVMPDGLSMVPAQERHAVDWNLILIGMNQNKQLMAESAQGFIPQILGDQDKEMTAQEFLGRMNMSISLTGAVMNQLADQSRSEYREVCRRFCIKGSSDPMVKRFQEKVAKEGVPKDMLDCEAWDIVPEQTLGAGNKAVELNVTQAAMQELLPYTDPNGQRQILRRRALALTDNAAEAMLLFPEAPQPPSNDAQYAQQAYAVLMLGVPFAKKEGLSHIVYAATLMEMMRITLGQVAAAVQQPDGLAIAADKIMGLFNVASHVQEEIDIIARVENQRDTAKSMFKALTEMGTHLTNIAKELQSQSEQQQAQGGIDPETMAKIQEKQMLTQNQMQIDQAKAEQKREQKQAQWSEENERRNATVAADAQRKQALTMVEAQNMQIKTAAEVQALDMKTAAEIQRPKPAPSSK